MQFLLSSLATRTDTQIIRLDKNCGSVHYEGKIGEDLFQSEEDAKHFLLNVRKLSFKHELRFPALIGMVVTSRTAELLIGTKVRRDMLLFGGHASYTIIESQWIKITLGYPSVEFYEEPKERIQDFPVDGMHYYCDTMDLTHPYPSSREVSRFHHEFCWNEYLAKPFCQVGLRAWCVVLQQGIAISRRYTHQIAPNNQSEDETDTQVHVCLITRKSRVNPGTRYTARGLNKEGGPGNECECEFIIWRQAHGNPFSPVEWYSYLWRRGTVPVWWQATLKSPVSGPGLQVRSENPFQGSEKYYSRLLDRYGHKQIILVNMLRCDPNQKEVQLSEAYQESLKYVRGLVNIDLCLIKFDWHHILKQLGPETTAEGFWSSLRGVVKRTGLSRGFVHFEEIEESELSNFVHLQQYCPTGALATHTIVERQGGIPRFNCADSLDRTNIATFFLSIQLMGEMCRRFGVGLNEEICRERNVDLTSEWCFFYSSLPLVKKVIKKNLIDILTELFVYNGDVIAMLYTNSMAMHSGLMREFSEHVSSAPINAILAIKRRYHNVVSDPGRQMQYELFLGMHQMEKPNYQEPMTLLSSQESICVVNHIPSMFKNIHSNILFGPYENFCWLCPDQQNQAEVTVFLPQPSRVMEVALTLSHGQCEEMSPLFMDAYAGRFADRMRVIFQNRQLPRCSNSSKLYYSLLPVDDTSNHMRPSHRLYDFHRSDPNLAHLTRVVRLVFRGEGIGRLSLGKIEIYGTIVRPPRSPQSEFEYYKQKKADDIADHILERYQGESLISSLSNSNPTVRAAPPLSDTEDTYSSLSKSHASLTEPDYASASPGRGLQPDQQLFEDTEGGEEEDPLPTPAIPPAVHNRPLLNMVSPKRLVLDFTSVIEDYTGNIIKSRVSYEQENNPKVVVVQDFDESLEPPPLSCADQLSGNPQEQYKQLVMLKRRMSRRDKASEVEGYFSEKPVFSLLDQLELEHFRLSNGITTTERDLLLQDVNVPVLLCDPTHSMYPRSHQEESIRRKIEKSSSKQCWQCKQTIKLFQNSVQCHYCRHNYCSTCAQANSTTIPEFCWSRPSVVCHTCFDVIQQQKAYIPAILSQNRQLKSSPLLRSAARFLASIQRSAPSPGNRMFSLSKLHLPLSDFPKAGILTSVPTEKEAFPIESILVPPSTTTSNSYWFAPQGLSTVELDVVLSSEAFITQLVLIMDPLGYTADDVPSIKVHTGMTIDDLHHLFDWTLVVGECQPHQTVIHELPRMEHCRFVRFTLRLPRSQQSSNNPFLHLGRLRIFGHPITSFSTMNITESEKRAYQSFLKMPSPSTKALLKVAYQQYNKSTSTLDIKPIGTASGFNIVIKHDTEGGVASQIKLLRVYGVVTYGEKKVLFQTVHELQTFVIPKCRPNQLLSYRFLGDPSKYQSFSFEFVSSYGGIAFPPWPPKISLYKNNLVY